MKQGTLTRLVPGRALLAFGLAFLASAIVVISFGNSQPTLGAEGGARMSLRVYSGTSTAPGALICDVGSAYRGCDVPNGMTFNVAVLASALPGPLEPNDPGGYSGHRIALDFGSSTTLIPQPGLQESRAPMCDPGSEQVLSGTYVLSCQVVPGGLGVDLIPTSRSGILASVQFTCVPGRSSPVEIVGGEAAGATVYIRSGSAYFFRLPLKSQTGASGGLIADAVQITCIDTPTHTPLPSPTDTPTTTQTHTPTDTPTHTPTNTSTNTPTNTSTNTPTKTPTHMATDAPTNTSTSTPTNTPTHMATDSPTNTSTPTSTNTPTSTSTPTNTPTETPTSTLTPTPTRPPTNTPTPTPTQQPTFTPTPTFPSTPTPTPTVTPANTPNDTPSDTPVNTATNTPIPVDLTGTWFVDLTGDVTDTCSYVFVQEGVAITGSMSCASLGPGDFVGAVEGDSFDLTGSIFGGDFHAVGTVDGATLGGTWNASWAANPSGVSGALFGSTNPPTPLPASTATQEPTSEVAVVTEPPPDIPPPDIPHPGTTNAVIAPNDLKVDVGVIGTNVILTFVLLAILLVSSSLFNDTLAENRYEIEDMLGVVLSPFRSLFGFFGGAVGSLGIPTRVVHLLALPLMLLATGVIYSFNDSGVGLNIDTVLLFFSLVIGIGIITVVYEGGQALVMQRRFHVEASMDVVPFALGIAAFFVLLSRLVNFQAPILYGFVAAASILRAAEVEEEQEGFAVAVPSFILLALSLVAWSLLGPLRDLSSDSERWIAHLPDEVAAIVFAGGIEGLVFAMIPIAFTDGIKVFHWQKFSWLVLFGVPTFLFSWVILNPEAEAFSALLEGRVLFAFGLAIAYAAMTFGVWLYFLRTKGSAMPAGGLQPQPNVPSPGGGEPRGGDAQLAPSQRTRSLVLTETSPNHFTVVDEGRV